MAAFKRKLAECSISSPQEDALGRVYKHFTMRMVAAAGPSVNAEVARDLYFEAKMMLGTTSRAIALQQSHLSINGPWHGNHPFILSAVDLVSGALHMIKLLPLQEMHQRRSGQAELLAVQALGLANLEAGSALVPVEPIMLQTHQDDVQLHQARAACCALRFVCKACSKTCCK